MRTDDRDLVHRTLAGDWSAFSDLVERYRDAACGLAYHYLGDFDEAQDAAQEAFLRAYERLSQLRDQSRFGPWLRRITATICSDFLRRRADRVISLDSEQARAAASAPEDGERITARIVVRQALARLSDKARLAATLYYINGYSHGEIASFLDVPINTVRTRLHRAKKRLREEMIAMVSDVLHQGRPDPDFAKRVVEEAMRRGRDAHRAHAAAQALHHYDEGLSALDDLPPGPQQQKLKMDLLWAKGGASEFSPGWAEAVKLYEQALAIAQDLGDRAAQATMLGHIGVTRSNMGDKDKARECYHQAARIFRDLGDKTGEGMCLFWLASLHLFAKQPAPARPYLEQALPLLDAAGSCMWAAVCRAALGLIADVPEDRFPSLIESSASCVVLRESAGVVAFVSEPGVGQSERAEAPAMFSIGDVFHNVGYLRTFLDPSVPVGGTWSGDSFSYSYQPLKTTVTVESGLPDEAEQRKLDLNRSLRCGTRRAWYAPGVGLVQLQVEQGGGAKALIQLQQFALEAPSQAYLPLAIGNSWTYTWADAPPGFVARDAYRVAAQRGDEWFVEHHSYVYPQP